MTQVHQIMNQKNHVPAFVSVVALMLGAYDLVRGFMHTILLEYSAGHLAKLNMENPAIRDLLQLLGAFGISNYITGIMLILLAIKARELALIMLGIIPAAYFIGVVSIKIYGRHYPPTATAWEGAPLLLLCLGVYLLTFILGVIKTQQNKKYCKSY